MDTVTALMGVRSRECTSLVMGFPGSAAVLQVSLHSRTMQQPWNTIAYEMPGSVSCHAMGFEGDFDRKSRRSVYYLNVLAPVIQPLLPRNAMDRSAQPTAWSGDLETIRVSSDHIHHSWPACIPTRGGTISSPHPPASPSTDAPFGFTVLGTRVNP
jgi:hypothetical protein